MLEAFQRAFGNGTEGDRAKDLSHQEEHGNTIPAAVYRVHSCLLWKPAQLEPFAVGSSFLERSATRMPVVVITLLLETPVPTPAWARHWLVTECLAQHCPSALLARKLLTVPRSWP
jgi:hypothetical protein